MKHRFGEESYSLIHDYWQADRELRRFNTTSRRDEMPEDEREAAYALLIGRMLDAREAVERHPPWVLTPDEVLDGATRRVVADFSRRARASEQVCIPEETMVWARDQLCDLISFELRRVLFDRGIAGKHAPDEPACSTREDFVRQHASLRFRPAVADAVDRAAWTHLGRFGEGFGSMDYAARQERLRDFGFDVIARYQRRKRGWFGWLFGRRHRRG